MRIKIPFLGWFTFFLITNMGLNGIAQPGLQHTWSKVLNNNAIAGSVNNGFNIRTDPQGNIYAVGRFELAADFDPGAGVNNLVSAGGSDIYFAKYNAGGNLLFAKGIGSTGSDVGYDLWLDAQNNIYIAGSYQNAVDFDPGPGVAVLPNAGVVDIFLAKYDANGNYLFAVSMGGTGNDACYALTGDAQGNVYLTGQFEGTVDVDPGPGTTNLVSNGTTDIFIAKFDGSGNLMYARGMGGTSEDIGRGIAVDASGGVYITGSFFNTVDFDPGAGTANLLSAGNRDVFLAKYDVNGNYVFAKNMGGIGNDYGQSIALGTGNNIYLAGSFALTADLDPGAGTENLVSAGNDDIFFAKYDANGDYVYAKGMGGTGNDYCYKIILDGQSNAFITGQYQAMVDFDPGANVENLVSSGTNQMYIARYDVNGSYVFARSIGGTATESGRGLAFDGNGNLFATGSFAGTSDFDPGPGTANLIIAADRENAFVASYTATGDYRFAGQIGAYPSGGGATDGGYAMVSDGAGNLFITGGFWGTVDFDPGPGVAEVTSVANEDIFFARYDPAGNLVFVRSLGGTGANRGRGIAIDGNRNIFITGSFGGTADFDPGNSTANLVSAGGTDIFLARYDAQGNYMWAKRMGGSAGDIGNAIAIDGTGNLLVTGTYTGTVDFDPGPGTVSLTNAGGLDIFLAKFDADGNYLYAKGMGGTLNESSNALAIDNNGNAYITGSFGGNADFDPGPNTATLATAGNLDAFVAKYDPSGNYVYAIKMGGTGSDVANGLAVTPAGSVVVTGIFTGTADFDPGAGTTNLVSAGSNDIFISRYDLSGNLLFANRVGSNESDMGLFITLDGSGHSYITGSFSGNVDFDPGTGTTNLQSRGGTDWFIARYNVDGTLVFAKNYGSAGPDVGRALALDGAGSIYITGSMVGMGYLDDAPSATLLKALNDNDIFIAKYNMVTQPAGFTTVAPGLWSAPSTWSNGLVPDANSAVTILHSITIDIDATCHSLKAGSSAQVNISPGKKLIVLQ